MSKEEGEQERSNTQQEAPRYGETHKSEGRSGYQQEVPQTQQRIPWREWWNHWATRDNIQAVSTVVLTIFTVIYAVTTIWQFIYLVGKDRLDQRAWVGPTNTLKANIVAGSKATFGFLITNTGKTPARRYIAHAATKSLAKGERFVATYPQTLSNRYATVLQPGMQVNAIVQTKGELTQERIDQMKSGERIQYVYGEILYQDIFGQCHHVVFCVFLLPNLTSSLSCDTYNAIAEVECKEQAGNE